MSEFEHDGEENHRPLNELNPKRLDIVKRQAIVDHADEKHAQNRAEHGAAASEERRSANDDGGDRVEFQTCRGDRLSRVKPTRQNDAAQARESARYHIDEDLRAPDRNARHHCRFAVSPNRINLAAEHSLLQHEGPDNESR